MSLYTQTSMSQSSDHSFPSHPSLCRSQTMMDSFRQEQAQQRHRAHVSRRSLNSASSSYQARNHATMSFSLSKCPQSHQEPIDAISQLDHDDLFTSCQSSAYFSMLGDGLTDAERELESHWLDYLWPSNTRNADVLVYLLQKEATPALRPDPFYSVRVQKDLVKPWMRRQLLDWLLELTTTYRYQSDTFTLAADYCDRFLSSHRVPVHVLQLLGATCFLLAAKLKERHSPKLRDLVAYADHAYTVQDVQQMEHLVLHALQWRVHVPTAHLFLHQLLPRIRWHAIHDDTSTFMAPEGGMKAVRENAELLINMMTLDIHFLSYKPSAVAACAAVCSLTILNAQWPSLVDQILALTRMELCELEQCGKRAFYLWSQMHERAASPDCLRDSPESEKQAITQPLEALCSAEKSHSPEKVLSDEAMVPTPANKLTLNSSMSSTSSSGLSSSAPRVPFMMDHISPPSKDPPLTRGRGQLVMDSNDFLLDDLWQDAAPLEDSQQLHHLLDQSQISDAPNMFRHAMKRHSQDLQVHWPRVASAPLQQ